MGKDHLKYVSKLPKELRIKLDQIIEKIKKLEIEELDCKKLRGYETLFRVRVGKIRIVFEKRERNGIILKINTRGDSY